MKRYLNVALYDDGYFSHNVILGPFETEEERKAAMKEWDDGCEHDPSKEECDNEENHSGFGYLDIARDGTPHLYYGDPAIYGRTTEEAA